MGVGNQDHGEQYHDRQGLSQQPPILWVWGLQIGVESMGFRVQRSAFRVRDLGFRVKGEGFSVEG